VGHHSEAFIGIDTSKLRNAVAIAEGGRDGEVRYLGEIDATEAATQKLVAKLAAKYDHLTFCYEAGPTGYGLYRLIRKLGPDCIVAAPSLTPKKPGDRVAGLWVRALRFCAYAASKRRARSMQPLDN
jgi:transposase